MEQYKITTKTLDAVLQYLSSQPFANVAGLIDAIQKEVATQQQEPITVPTKEDEKESDE